MNDLNLTAEEKLAQSSPEVWGWIYAYENAFWHAQNSANLWRFHRSDIRTAGEIVKNETLCP